MCDMACYATFKLATATFLPKFIWQAMYYKWGQYNGETNQIHIIQNLARKGISVLTILQNAFKKVMAT